MNILDEAANLVDGARQLAYGHPGDNLKATAELVTIYLRRAGKLKPGERLTIRDWCNMQVLSKVGRDANEPKRDNHVDIAGWVRANELAFEPRVKEQVQAELLAAEIRTELEAEAAKDIAISRKQTDRFEVRCPECSMSLANCQC